MINSPQNNPFSDKSLVFSQKPKAKSQKPPASRSWPKSYWFGGGATGIAVFLVCNESIPLGIEGDGGWKWSRFEQWPDLVSFTLPVFAFGVYLLLVLLGHWLLNRFREWLVIFLLPMLLASGGVLQYFWLELPVLGMERWPLALYHEACSGYFSIARQAKPTRIEDLQGDGTDENFLAGYAEWIAKQDNIHIGTHPPGLILLNRGLLDYFTDHPQYADRLVRSMPRSFSKGLEETAKLDLSRGNQLSTSEQATLGSVAILTWFVGLITLLPLYALARMGAQPAIAWNVAALWPTVPAVLLFLPLGDCLYPFLAVMTVFLVLWSAQIRLAVPAVIGGIVWCVGAMFSLALLTVLPIVLGALVLAIFRSEKISISRLLVTVLAMAAGIVLPLEWMWYQYGFNLPAVWSINLAKHAGFYDVMPRTYWPWIVVNLLELAVVTGPAVTILAVRALFRRVGPAGWTGLAAVHLCGMLTLVALDLTGRNLGEVARLWILFTPFLCLGAGRFLSDQEGDWKGITVLLFFQAVIVLALLCTVEPLLPVHDFAG